MDKIDTYVYECNTARQMHVSEHVFTITPDSIVLCSKRADVCRKIVDDHQPALVRRFAYIKCLPAGATTDVTTYCESMKNCLRDSLRSPKGYLTDNIPPLACSTVVSPTLSGSPTIDIEHVHSG